MNFSGIAHKEKPLYGVQFHPEVDLSVNGIEVLKNFLFDIAGCHGTFTMRSRETSCIEYIKETAGSHKILVGNWNQCKLRYPFSKKSK